MVAARRFVLLGDYGAGKSMTLREVYLGLAREFRSGRSTRFPIYLNLRDHHAQTDPTEALIRHGTALGLPSERELVRAWNAGYVHVILDGFDEIATPGWVGSLVKVRETRHRAMELVRGFIRGASPGCGLIIAGRQHFFDSAREMGTALALDQSFETLEAGAFDEKQIENFLKSRGWRGAVPTWLPARPLLLSYLVSKGVLQRAVEIGPDRAPAAAWDDLMTLICQREAEIEASIDGQTLRLVVERLASFAREQQEAVGPVTYSQIVDAFREICGYDPDDRATVLLQRLPGLGPADAEDGTRQFVDRDFADCAGAGDIVSFVSAPYPPMSSVLVRKWNSQLGSLGIECVSHALDKTKIKSAAISVAIREAAALPAGSSMVGDLARTLLYRDERLSSDRSLVASGLVFPEFRLDAPNADLRQLTLEDCIIIDFEFPRDGTPATGLPYFRSCDFQRINGRSSKSDLPAERFDDACSCEQFSEYGFTTDSILERSLEPGVRVGLVLLKKLYMQRGGGRQGAGLKRGLPQNDRNLVDDVLRVLERDGLAFHVGGAGDQWVPARSATGRIWKILSAPSTCQDPLIDSLALVKR